MATLTNTPASSIMNFNAEDQRRFNALWGLHVRLLGQGKVVYFIPQGMALRIDITGTLSAVARRLSDSLGTDIYVHYDRQYHVYRVGQIFDDHDRNSVFGLACYSLAQAAPPPPPAPVAVPNPTVAPAASMSTPTAKIPKPENSWILYRKSKHSVVRNQNPSLHTSQISRIIGHMWKHEPDDVKNFWRQKAQEAKTNHALKHPAYKLQPRKSSAIKRRKSSQI